MGEGTGGGEGEMWGYVGGGYVLGICVGGMCEGGGLTRGWGWGYVWGRGGGLRVVRRVTWGVRVGREGMCVCVCVWGGGAGYEGVVVGGGCVAGGGLCVGWVIWGELCGGRATWEGQFFAIF